MSMIELRIEAEKAIAKEMLDSYLYSTPIPPPLTADGKEETLLLTNPAALGESWNHAIQSITITLKEKINHAIKSNYIEVLVRGLKVAQQTKYIPFETLLLLINQGNTENLQECTGPIKSDPRICNFIKTGNLEFVPPPPPPPPTRASFDKYISDHQKCLKTQDAFEVCKEIFCAHIDEKHCEGRTLPPFEAFDKGEL